MAELSKLVVKIRRRVNDYCDPNSCEPCTQKFPDEVYEDAIADALSRFNCDTGEDYVLVDVPQQYERILVDLALINMYTTMFSIDSLDDPDGEPSEAKVSRIQVQGLETWYHKGKTLDSGELRRMIDDIEKRYQAWLDKLGFSNKASCQLPSVTTHTVNVKHARSNYALRNCLIDKGLVNIDKEIRVAFSSKGRKVIWAAVYDDQFAHYILQRRVITQMWEDADVVTRQVVNINSFFVDTTPLEPNTYQYRVRVINKNGIAINTKSVTVVIE